MGLNSEDIRLRVELGFRIKFHIKASRDLLISELKKLIDIILRENYQMRIPSYTICTQDGFEVLEILRVGDILEDGQRIHIDPFGSAGCFALLCGEQQGSDVPKPAVLSKKSNIEDLSNHAGKGGMARKNQPRRTGVERKKLIKDTGISSKNVSKLPGTASKDETTYSQPTGADITKDMVVNNDLKNPGNAQNEDEKADNEKIVLKTSEDDTKPEAVQIPESANTQEPPEPDNFKGFVDRKSDLTKNESSRFEEQGFFKPLKKRKAEEDVFEII